MLYNYLTVKFHGRASDLNELKQIIGKNIIELRKSNGMTQAELAEKINYSDKAVSKWECGDAMPDVGVLKQLADLLGVTVDYLLNENHEEQPPVQSESYARKKNKLIITFLSATLVWLIATLIFTIVNICAPGTGYTGFVFIYAVPVTMIVFLVFNSLWGKQRRNFIIITALIWTSLASLYFVFFEYNIWLVFTLGIPAQIIVLLWSRLKKIQ